MGVKVKRLRGDKWYVVIYRHGKRRVFACSSKKEADVAARDIRKELGLAKWSPSENRVETGIKELDCLGLQIKRYESPVFPVCVYFLCRKKEVIYVGQTSNLAKRIMNHQEDNSKIFDSVFYAPTAKKKASQIEADLIRTLKPKLNKLLNSQPDGQQAVTGENDENR